MICILGGLCLYCFMCDLTCPSYMVYVCTVSSVMLCLYCIESGARLPALCDAVLVFVLRRV